MPQYIKIAEEIINELKNKVGIKNDLLATLNLIIRLLRLKLKGSNLILKYNYIGINEIYRSNESVREISLDFSLMPKDINSNEYLLWVASFVEKVTEDQDKLKNYENDRKIIMERYIEYLNIKNGSINKNDEACKNINLYFKDNFIKEISIIDDVDITCEDIKSYFNQKINSKQVENVDQTLEDIKNYFLDIK